MIQRSPAQRKVTAIIGPNGCGKSTFLKAVNCMIPAASGSIRLGQREVHDFSRKALSRKMAFLTQTMTCRLM